MFAGINPNNRHQNILQMLFGISMLHYRTIDVALSVDLNDPAVRPHGPKHVSRYKSRTLAPFSQTGPHFFQNHEMNTIKS